MWSSIEKGFFTYLSQGSHRAISPQKSLVCCLPFSLFYASLRSFFSPKPERARGGKICRPSREGWVFAQRLSISQSSEQQRLSLSVTVSSCALDVPPLTSLVSRRNIVLCVRPFAATDRTTDRPPSSGMGEGADAWMEGLSSKVLFSSLHT